MERLAPAAEAGTERPQRAQEGLKSLPPKVEVAAETPQTQAAEERGVLEKETASSEKQEAIGQEVARAEALTLLEQATAEASLNEPLQAQIPTPVQGDQGRQEQPPQPEQRSKGKQGKAQGQKQRQRQGQADTRLTKVFVGGLAWHTTRETLASFFSRFGEVEDSVVILDRQTGRSKGYGFVTFKEASAAERACVNGTPCIDNRTANCNLASLGLKHSPQHQHQQQLPRRFHGAGPGEAGGWGRGRGGGRGGQRLQYAPQHPFQAGGASPRGFGRRPGSQGAPPGGFMPFHVAYQQQQQLTNPLTQQQQPLYGMHPLGPAQAGQGYAYGQAGQGYAYGQPFGVAGMPLMGAQGFPFSPQGQGMYGGYVAGGTQGVPMADYSSTPPPSSPGTLAPRTAHPSETQAGTVMGGGAARGVPMAVYAPTPGGRAPGGLTPQMEHAGPQAGGVMPAPYVSGYLSTGTPQLAHPVLYPLVPSTGPPTLAPATATATAAAEGAPAVRPQKAIPLASALPPHLQKQQQQQQQQQQRAEAAATGAASASPPQAGTPHAATSATPPDPRDAAWGRSGASGAPPDAAGGEARKLARTPEVAPPGPTPPAQAEALAPHGLDHALAMQERQPP